MTTTDKQALFELGLEKDLALRKARVSEREIALTQAEARIAAVQQERDVFFASLVDDQGFGISDIGRILDTKNWKSANDAVVAGRLARAVRAESAVNR